MYTFHFGCTISCHNAQYNCVLDIHKSVVKKQEVEISVMSAMSTGTPKASPVW